MNLAPVAARRSVIAVSALTSCLWMCTGAAKAQGTATFQGIGTVPGLPNSDAKDVSADGTIVTGIGSGPTSSNAIRWTQASGIAVLIDLAGLSGSQGLGVSGNGTVFVGFGSDTGGNATAVRWSPSPSALPHLSGVRSIAHATSANGSVIVGESDNTSLFSVEAVRWSGGAVQGLGFLAGGTFSQAFGISADGAVIVGHSNGTGGFQAFRWSAGGPMVGLGDVPGGSFGSGAFSISADGTVIVGLSESANGPEAFRWENNVMTPLGDLPGNIFSSQARDVSADGTVIVGQGAGASGDGAFIWTQGTGMQSVRALLVSHGLSSELTGWTLTTANAVSADGLTIVGSGTRSGHNEGWIARLAAPDSDGDGLTDDWEINGIPFTDASGAPQRYELNFNGNPGPDCNVNRKDIFVEVDSMTGQEPSASAFTSVKTAFDNAPVSNSNGAASGIKLHVLLGENNIPAADWTLDDTNGNTTLDWPTEFDALKLSASSGTTLPGYFGTPDERNHADAVAKREARKKAVRYCIFGRAIDPTSESTGPSGIAELPGNDFCVTMGQWTNGGFPSEKAGTFMHELGHTLGLHHGGGDDINHKPSYYSVMNYSFQTPKSWMPPGTWPLEPNRPGFSTFALLTLNENTLSECAAQVVPGSALAGTYFISSYVDSRGLVNEWFGRYDLATDWNNSGPPCEDPIAVDINRLPIVEDEPAPDPSPGETLIGHDDWSSLTYNFRDQPSFADGVHNTDAGEGAVIDITFEQNQALANALPPFCPGDIVDDRSVDVDDLIAVILAWGACPNGCLADITPLPADGQVDVDDLIAVILAWGDCP